MLLWCFSDATLFITQYIGLPLVCRASWCSVSPGGHIGCLRACRWASFPHLGSAPPPPSLRASEISVSGTARHFLHPQVMAEYTDNDWNRKSYHPLKRWSSARLKWKFTVGTTQTKGGVITSRCLSTSSLGTKGLTFVHPTEWIPVLIHTTSRGPIARDSTSGCLEWGGGGEQGHWPNSLYILKFHASLEEV